MAMEGADLAEQQEGRSRSTSQPLLHSQKLPVELVLSLPHRYQRMLDAGLVQRCQVFEYPWQLPLYLQTWHHVGPLPQPLHL